MKRNRGFLGSVSLVLCMIFTVLSVGVINISAETSDNITSAGYYFCDDDGSYAGYRFLQPYTVNEVTITAGEQAIPAGKLIAGSSEVDVAEIAANESETIALSSESVNSANFIIYLAENADTCTIAAKGAVNEDSATDIFFEGYVSAADGWQPAENYVFGEKTGRVFGIGFDKEVTITKVRFLSITDELPDRIIAKTTDDDTLSLQGTPDGHMVEFNMPDSYAYGAFFDFGDEYTINAIEVYGDTEYKGGSHYLSGDSGYTFFLNGISENDSRVIANTGEKLLTSEPVPGESGSDDREWTLTEDISEAPSFSAPNTPLAEAVYNMSMEEVVKKIDSENDVWTEESVRGSSVAMQSVLSWVFPEVSMTSAESMVDEIENALVFEAASEGEEFYPVPVDEMIIMPAVWEAYLATGDKDFLKYCYYAANNTYALKYNSTLNATAEPLIYDDEGLDVPKSKTAITNILYCQSARIMKQASEELGADQNVIDMWNSIANRLEYGISTNLWHEELGGYATLAYPTDIGSPLAYKLDILANGYAVMYNIGTEEQIQAITENYPLLSFGAVTVFPQYHIYDDNGTEYHNQSVAPGMEAPLMIGAAGLSDENNLLAEELWNSQIRSAASNISNYEYINYTEGGGVSGTDANLSAAAATLSGYYRVLFGMEYTMDGITFDPYIPKWMEGPFEISGLNYRNASLTLKLCGEGDTVESITVNGEVVDDPENYVFPADAEGEYEIEITLYDSDAEDTINLSWDNRKIAPEPPKVELTGEGLEWTYTVDSTYRVWNGGEFITTEEPTYAIENSGTYYVVTVSSETGLWSEPSKFIQVGRICVGGTELKDGEYITSDGQVGTAYVEENIPSDSYAYFYREENESEKFVYNLVLNNYTYSGEGYTLEREDEATDGAAILYTGDAELNIILKGSSSVTHSGNSEAGGVSNGLSVYGDLTISGDGELTANGGDANYQSDGIYCEGTLTVNNGKITAVGNEIDTENGNTSNGIYVENMIVNGGLVIASSAAENAEYANGILIYSYDINGGTLWLYDGTVMASVPMPEKEYCSAIYANNYYDEGYIYAFARVAGANESTPTNIKELRQVEAGKPVIIAKNLYNVSFDANGGEGEMEDQTFAGLVESAISPNTFTRRNYSFVEWNTASDGSGTAYADGEEIIVEDTTILYAQWKKKSSGSRDSYTNTTTTTTKNEDGSTTKTTTNKATGTTTETTTYPDGSVTTVETKKDGTVTTTQKDSEGNTTTTVENSDGTVTVTKTDKNGNEITDTEDKEDTKDTQIAFVDVAEDDWYYGDVEYAVENGLFNGTTSTTFEPDGLITRAMMVTVLYRAEGEPATNRSIPFADVDMGAYYANAVIWAKQNGIVMGVSENEFEPDTNITREQIAAIIYRWAVYKDMDAVTMEENLHFADSSEISEYAVSAMNWAVGRGLMKGKTESTINPKDNATRAEIAAILHRFIETEK